MNLYESYRKVKIPKLVILDGYKFEFVEINKDAVLPIVDYNMGVKVDNQHGYISHELEVIDVNSNTAPAFGSSLRHKPPISNRFPYVHDAQEKNDDVTFDDEDLALISETQASNAFVNDITATERNPIDFMDFDDVFNTPKRIINDDQKSFEAYTHTMHTQRKMAADDDDDDLIIIDSTDMHNNNAKNERTNTNSILPRNSVASVIALPGKRNDRSGIYLLFYFNSYLTIFSFINFFIDMHGKFKTFLQDSANEFMDAGYIVELLITHIV